MLKLALAKYRYSFRHRYSYRYTEGRKFASCCLNVARELI